MSTYYCDLCDAELQLVWDENCLVCPECGWNCEISDEEKEDFDGYTDVSYCNMCEHSEEYPTCKNKCPYVD